ncbi:MAG: DDE-type integrase/transposase/recombinase, partial [Oceanicaulis sp.]|nr:DDE-type integrase/transposase/recombinase [Oceanicaulis sp.]
MTLGSQIIEYKSEGYLTFEAKLDPYGNKPVKLYGCFSDSTDNVILCRDEMPIGVEISEGVNYTCAGTLIKYPSHKFALRGDLTIEWKVLRADIMTTSEIIKTHYNLCHVSTEKLYRTLQLNGIKNNKEEIHNAIEGCEVCEGKTKRAKPQGKEDRTQDWIRGGMAQADYTQTAIEGLNGIKYILTIYDCQTGYITAEAHRQRKDAPQTIARFLIRNPHISLLRMDNAQEFKSQELTAICNKLGVSMEYSAPGSSQSIGGAERAHQTLKRHLDTCIIHFGAQSRPEVWPWMLDSAVFAINNVISDRRQNTPHKLRETELKKHNKTKETTYHPKDIQFGDPVYFTTPIDNKGKEKLPSGKREGIFLCKLHSGECTVIGIQDELPTRWSVHTKWISKAVNTRREHIMQEIKWALGVENNRWVDNTTRKQEQKIHEKVMKVMRCNKYKGSFVKGYGWVAADEIKPEEMKPNEFNNADQKEWDQIHAKQVMTEYTEEVRQKIIQTRIRRTKKIKADGTEVPKTRFIACATNDNRDIPTRTHLPINWLRRIITCSALTRGWKLATIDVRSAFLLVPIQEQVLIRLPPALPKCALELGYKEHGTYKLNKALYGLKEAPLLF